MLSVATIFLSVLALAQGNSAPQTIAFTVAFTKVTTIKENEVVKYNKVFTNIGKAYDSNTGIFTAPLDGLYEFHLYVVSLEGSSAWLALVHNGVDNISVQAIPAPSRGTSTYGTAGNYELLTLEAGDRIQVKAVVDSTVFGTPGEQCTTFSGRLVASTSI